MIFDLSDKFEGVYFVKSGILSETIGHASFNKNVGDIIGIRSLVYYMNLLIYRGEATEEDIHGFTNWTTLESIRESSVLFFDKDNLVKMIFSNQDFFDLVYKLYYQHYILKTNVRGYNPRTSEN